MFIVHITSKNWQKNIFPEFSYIKQSDQSKKGSRRLKCQMWDFPPNSQPGCKQSPGTAFQEMCIHCTLGRLEKTFHTDLHVMIILHRFDCDSDYVFDDNGWWSSSQYRECDDKSDCILFCIIVCWNRFPFSSASKSYEESATRDIFHFNIQQIALCTALQMIVESIHHHHHHHHHYFHQLQSNVREVQSVIFCTSTFRGSSYALHSRR